MDEPVKRKRKKKKTTRSKFMRTATEVAEFIRKHSTELEYVVKTVGGFVVFLLSRGKKQLPAPRELS